MKTCKFYTLSFLLILIIGVVYPCFGQEAGFPPIERDESFEPYVRFEEETGRYFIGHLRDADTGEVFEAVYEPPTLISPTIHSNLYNGNQFNYEYKTINGIESRQGIISLQLEIKDQFQEIILPDRWFYMESSGVPFIGITHGGYDIPEREENEPIIVEADLSIGDSLQFNVTSENPPTIVDVYVSGRPTVLNFHFVLAPTLRVQDIRDSLRTQVEGADDRGVLVKTIGPKSPPDPFDHPDFLDSLRGYIPQAGQLEWAAGEDFTAELSGLLDDARSRLAAGDSAGAAASLVSFTGLVEQASRGEGPPATALTSEGYALLFFNAQYLLGRLPAPPGEGFSIPELPAALTIASGSASGAFAGDSFTISGLSHGADGQPSGSGMDVHGVAATTAAASQGILNGLQSFQEDNITGSDPPPDIVQQSLSFEPDSLVARVLAAAGQTLPVNAAGSFGSPGQPVVVHAPQGLMSSGAITGNGILLVDGPFFVSGTIDWTGLVIHRDSPVSGPALSVSTSLSITGAMLMVNKGPWAASVQVSNILNLRYSPDVLQQLRQTLSTP